MLIGAAVTVGTSYLAVYVTNNLLGKKMNAFVFGSLMLIVTNLLEYVIEYYVAVWMQVDTEHFIHRLRHAYTQAITREPLTGIDVNTNINSLTNNMTIISDQYFLPFLTINNAIYRSVLTAGAIFSFHWVLLILTLITITFTMVMPRFFQKRIAAASENVSERTKHLIATLNDWLKGISALYWTKSLAHLWGKISPAAKKLEDGYVHQTKVSVLVGELENIFAVLSQVLITLVAGILALRGVISFGVAVNISNFVYQVFLGITIIVNNYTKYLGGKAIMDQVATVIEHQPAHSSSSAVETSIHKLVSVRWHDLKIRYNNETSVSFSDGEVIAGQKVALVGPSGSGKTTFIKALTGLIPDYGGSLTVNGTEAKQIDAFAFPDFIGYVPQKVHLFNDTIRNNITLFDEHLADKVDAVLASVNLLDRVKQLPHQSDESVYSPDDRPILSGGEQQRIAIARVLIRGKKFLILDEGDTGIDPAATREIIGRLLADKTLTLLMITHTADVDLLHQFDQVIRLSPR